MICVQAMEAACDRVFILASEKWTVQLAASRRLERRKGPSRAANSVAMPALHLGMHTIFVVLLLCSLVSPQAPLSPPSPPPPSPPPPVSPPRPNRDVPTLAADVTRALTAADVDRFYEHGSMVLRGIYPQWFTPDERRITGAAIATVLLDAPAVCELTPSDWSVCASQSLQTIGVLVVDNEMSAPIPDDALAPPPPSPPPPSAPPESVPQPSLSPGDVYVFLATLPLPNAPPGTRWYVLTEEVDAAAWVDPAWHDGRPTAWWRNRKGGWPHEGGGGPWAGLQTGSLKRGTHYETIESWVARQPGARRIENGIVVYSSRPEPG